MGCCLSTCKKYDGDRLIPAAVNAHRISINEDQVSVQNNTYLPKFVNLSDFKALGRIPRNPDDKRIIVSIDAIDRDKSLLIYISHAWERGWPGADGWDGRPHPDFVEGYKYKLLIEAAEAIWARLAPRFDNCYLWMDYFSIDQDCDPAGELKSLPEIITVSDCLVTIIYDPDWEKWEYPSGAVGNWFEAYGANRWRNDDYAYMNRGWMRMELLYGSNLPLISSSQQRVARVEGILQSAFARNYRPHFLYGTHESMTRKPPLSLPIFRGKFLEKFYPTHGCLPMENDRIRIEKLISHI